MKHSLPDFLDFLLFTSTIVSVKRKVGRFSDPPTQEVRTFRQTTSGWGCWQQGFRAKAYERFHSTVKVPMDAFVQLGET